MKLQRATSHMSTLSATVEPLEIQLQGNVAAVVEPRIPEVFRPPSPPSKLMAFACNSRRSRDRCGARLDHGSRSSSPVSSPPSTTTTTTNNGSGRGVLHRRVRHWVYQTSSIRAHIDWTTSSHPDQRTREATPTTPTAHPPAVRIQPP